jgi:hypothetical protein
MFKINFYFILFYFLSARTLVFYPQVTSKRTLQSVQVTDAPAAIVRSSVRPSENVRTTTMTGSLTIPLLLVPNATIGSQL